MEWQQQTCMVPTSFSYGGIQPTILHFSMNWVYIHVGYEDMLHHNIAQDREWLATMCEGPLPCVDYMIGYLPCAPAKCR